ncbi:MAG: hypothetical protein K6G55_07305 [Selenomonadaceae bacterium]|nr:hypothetical protein [Selenomonadaceae bacterium]
MFIKKFFGLMLLVALIILPQNVSAEKTDWFDRNFNFHRMRNVIVFNVDFNQNYNSVDALNMRDTYYKNARKLKCNIITEEEARRSIGYQIGMDLESMARSNPLGARQVIMENAYNIADGWVTATVDTWENTYYIEPERTVWEQRRETRTYYDAWGQRREEVYYVQVPVTYPPRRVDVSTIQMTLQLFDARSGAQVFSRKDVRDREDYQAQKGMYGRITNSFFEDVGKKIK